MVRMVGDGAGRQTRSCNEGAAKGWVMKMKVIGYEEVFAGVPRKLGLLLISLSALFVCVLLLQGPAHAGESVAWTGEGKDGAWTNPCNWYPRTSASRTIRARAPPNTRPSSPRPAAARRTSCLARTLPWPRSTWKLAVR